MKKKMSNWRLFLVGIFVVTVCAPMVAQTAHFSYFSYCGTDGRFDEAIKKEGQYRNPILSGFYPDPSICRKDDTYYMVTSTFGFFPGVPLFTSKDLVNWEQHGHVLDRDSQLSLHKHGISEGIFAPAIAYNETNQTFYMVTMNMGERTVFYVKSTDPTQGWSEPIQLRGGGLDPSFLFDTDGKGYLVYTTRPTDGQRYPGEMAVYMYEFCADGDSLKGDQIQLVRGGTDIEEFPEWLEGPHLYHIGDYYYLMCAEGGTQAGHREVIFRSDNPYGPWESYSQNPILIQKDLDCKYVVSSTGHADLIETPEGDWWAVFLGCRPYEGDYYNTGRDTYLLPVTWDDSWPIILKSGLCIPPVVDKKDVKLSENYFNGNFEYTDLFDHNQLNERWVYLRNPAKEFYSLDGKGIAMKALPVNVYQRDTLSAIFCRQQHPDFTAETNLSFNPQNDKELAGLLLLQNNEYNFTFGKTQLNGQPALVVNRNDSGKSLVSSVVLSAAQSKLPITLKVKGMGGLYSFYYKIANEEWLLLAKDVDATHLTTSKAGGFIGTMIGLYVTSNICE